MCRYMMADQFLGAIFTRLVKNEKYQIEFITLNKIEKQVDRRIREKHDAILCASINEIFSIVYDYSDFFQIKKNSIVINESFKKEFSKPKERDKFITRLDRYFLEGVPHDISNTVASVLEEALER